MTSLRFAKPCCDVSFHQFVRDSVDKPLHSLLSSDFLFCSGCGTVDHDLHGRVAERSLGIAPEEYQQQLHEEVHFSTTTVSERNSRDHSTSSSRAGAQQEQQHEQQGVINTQAEQRLEEEEEPRGVTRKRKKKRTSMAQRKKRNLNGNFIALSCSQFITGNQLLPHELMICNIVAARLPLVDLIRARCVCRAWRKSIFSSPEPNSFSSPDCHRRRLVVQHSSPEGSSLAAFDHCLNRWFVISTPSFRRLVAASCGLFCFETKVGRPPSLVIGNPLTQRWKHLPGIPLSECAHGPEILAMTADPVAGTYEVIALFGIWDDDASDAYLPFLYDSSFGRWEIKSPVSARHSFWTSSSIIKPPNTLLSIDANALNVLSYDISNDTSSIKQLQNFAPYINSNDAHINTLGCLPQIVTCNGRLFLVARHLGERRDESMVGQLPMVLHSSIGIWVMQPDFDHWEFMTNSPADLLEKVVKGSDGTDFITASDSCSHIFLILKGSCNMLVCNTASLSWTVRPGCPSDYSFYPFPRNAFNESLLWTASV